MDQREAIPKHAGSDEFDVRAALRRVSEACFGHKLVIILSCITTVGLMVAYLVIWPPVFQAYVTVVAEPEQDRSRDDFYASWAVFRAHDIRTEAELMTSKPVLERVVTELGLTYNDVHHPFMRYAGFLWTESWVGKRYRAMKERLFPPPPSPYAPTPEEIEFARTLDDFSTGVNVMAAADANVGNLVVRGPSPRVAEIANAMIRVYLDERKLRQLDEAKRAADALAREVEKAEGELRAVEDRREEYYDENSLLLEFEKDKVEIARWLELEASIVEEASSIESMERTLAELRTSFESEPREVVANRVMSRNDLLESMKSHRFTLLTRLQDASLRYRADSEEVREIQALIAGVDEIIASESGQVELSATTVLSETHESLRQQVQALEATLAGGRGKLEIKKQASAELRARINRIPQKMRVAHDLGRMQHVLEKKLLLLQEKQMAAEIFVTSVDVTPASIQVVSYASAPSKPIWPNKKVLLAVAGLLGLGVGVGLAVLLDTIRGRVSAGRLSHTGVGHELYATVEMDRARAGRGLRRSAKEPG